MHKRLIGVLLTLFLSFSLSLGSGFSIYEQGAKSMAMAGAFVAQANDVTAIFYNPAGITSLHGWNVALGGTIIQPQAQFIGPTVKDPNLLNKAKKETFVPPHFYASYQLNEKVSFGLSVFAPFGLASDWGKDWPGKYLATRSSVQAIFINPVIAYRIMENLSLAVGFEYAIADVDLQKMVNYPVRNIDLYSTLKASTTGMGFNLGLQFKPVEGLSIGAAFRSNVLLKFKEGDAKFDYPSIDPNDPQQQLILAELKALFPNTKGDADLKLPTFTAVGVSYDFTDKLTAEFDYFVIGWSSYDVLKVKFKDPVGGKKETVSERKYENSASYRLGLEYRLNEQLALRAGYMRDNHAVPDERVEPSLPEGDRNIYNIGFGYKIGHINVDFAYMLLLQDDREITESVDNFNGKYESLANLFSITLGYSF
ncbi:MAG: transporter [Caldisericaceae bacterium]|nr:transporter [Caldisericaceae bacterium]